MMSLASQMYDYYVKPYLGEKGQDLVEYALLLAIVVGVGFLIYQTSGLNENIKSIFTNANSVTSSAASVAKPK
jgi:Flp pilus assembly pilin Flp